MSFEVLHQFELELISKLQVLRSPLLDQFMLFCNYFDTSIFYFLLIPSVWFLYKRSLGIQIFYMQILACILAQWLKPLFGEPRPCQLIPEIALLFCTSFGFPSGAALATTSIFGLLAVRVRKWPFTLFCALFLLLVGASRVYLGMHFFSDVIGGYFFGACLVFLFVRLSPSIEAWFSAKASVVAISTLVCSVLYYLSPNVHSGLVMALGATYGLLLSAHQKIVPRTPALLWIRCLQCALAIVPFFIAKACTPYHKECYFISAIWMSYGIEKVFSKRQIQ